MLTSYKKTGSVLFAFVLLHVTAVLSAQCPTLSQTATFTSSDCAPGISPCTLCPGDVFTLTGSGTNIVPSPGNCINWYYGTTNNFNPYNGEGTLLGCSPITTAPINCGAPCPTFLGMFVDACGTEENNEFLGLFSGGGFNVDDLTIDFDDNNNVGSGNEDIGSGCSFQGPDPAILATLQNNCPNSTIIGVGSGQIVPPNVPVVVFTSAGMDFDYNFSGLCSVFGNVYVLQSSCTRTTGAFTNGGPNGLCTTSVSVCGCNSSITYNTTQLSGGNGAAVAQTPLGPIYLNAGCAFPTFPSLPGSGTPPIIATPLDVTVTQSMCNGGPYYVVGVYEPLPAGCAPTFTNYNGFNVPCPNPTLGTASVCDNTNNFNLVTLQDPNVPNGVWSGPGVNGTTFNATGQNGAVSLNFAPTGPCATAASTIITVNPTASAVISPVPPVCVGGSANLVVNFSGTAPWTFNLLANNILLNNFVTADNPVILTVNPTGASTTYTISGLQDANCSGPNTSIVVTTTAAPTGALSLVGPSNVCSGQAANFSINVANGTAPYSFQYAVNGVNGPVITSNTNPILFSAPILVNSTVTIANLSANGCPGNISGSVAVTVSPALSATTTNGKKTICSGLSDKVRFDFSGAGPFTFVHAINGVAQNPITTANAFYEITVTPGVGTNIYKLLSVSANGCTGSTVGADTIVVLPPATALISGNANICPGSNTVLNIQFTGNAPFVFDYSANGVAQNPITTSTNPFTITVTPAASTAYVLNTVSSGGCPGNVGGQAAVVVNDSLTATLTGGGQICQGGNGLNLLITFTGAGPYTFVYGIINNGVPIPQPAITTSMNPYVFPVNPINGTFYTLISVTAPGCTGTVSGQAGVFVFTPPTADMTGTAVFCDSAVTDIQVDFTGTGPFGITYTKDGVPQSPINTFDDPLFIPVNLSSTSTYVLTSVTSPGCTGIPNGAATLTVNYKPSYANVIFNCNPATVDYVIEFDVLGAKLPLTLVTGSGSFTGTHFTSNPISQASGYNIVFRDVNNCGDIVVSGAVNCNCQTNAGTMDLTPILLCAGDTAKAKHNNDFFNDGNDSLRFVLHSTPGFPLGTVYAWSKTPNFAQVSGILPGITYYISPIAGNPDGNGKIDLTDPCLSITEGTPVVFYPLPTASLGANINICAGATVSIPVILGGTAPFTLNWTSNGTPQTANNIASGFYPISFTAVNNTNIQLLNVSDAHCTANTPDTVQVNVNTTPQIQNLMYLCNLLTGTYTLSFDCVGSNPLTVGGVGGTFTGNAFTSVPITIGLPYNITLKDVNGCGQDTASGMPVCACSTFAGNLNQTPINLCYGQSVVSQPATGIVLEAADTLYYALINPGFAVVASNIIPVFQFNAATMFPDTVYLIVALAGNVVNGLLDFGDPCLSIASGAYVTWQAPITATLSGDTTICKNGTTQIRVDFTGKGPYSVSYFANGMFNALTGVTLNPLLIDVSPTVNTVYDIANVSGALGCTGTTSGLINVNLESPPQVLDVQVVCDFNTATYQLKFNIGNGAAPNSIYAVTGAQGVLTDTSFISNAIPKNQPYQVTVTNLSGCTTVISGVSNCVCPTFSGSLDKTPISNCLPDSTFSVGFNFNQSLDPNDTLQFVLCKDTATLPVGILQTSATPDFTFQTGMQTGTPYYVVAVAGTKLGAGIDWSDACLSISAKTPVVFYNQPTAKINGDTAICRDGGLSFKIRFTGQGPFTFSYAINGTPQSTITAPNNSFNISTNNVQQEQVFSLISVEDAHCTGVVTGTYKVAILPETSAALSGDATICVGDSTTLSLAFTGADTFDVVITDGITPFSLKKVITGSSFVVQPGTSNSYWISSYQAAGNICTGAIFDTVTVKVTSLSATAQTSDFNGFNISCAGARDGSIVLTPVGGTPPFTASWSNSANGLAINNLTPGTYSVTVTDNIGCIYKDSFTLNTPEPLAFAYTVKQPNCAGIDLGAITLVSASGGAGTYAVRVNAAPSQPLGPLPFVISDIEPGVFTLVVDDANGCSASQIDTILAPLPLVVDLGPDQTIQFGDSLLLVASVTGGSLLDKITWNPLTNLSSPGDLQTFVHPERSITYEISIKDTVGCKASDQIRITVDRSKRVYMPNVFEPDANAPNNYFTVYGGIQVVKVHYMRIYDRWGSKLFETKDILPNIPELGWDGKDRGQWVSPGVFAYEVMVEFRDGTTEVLVGDVSVLR